VALTQIAEVTQPDVDTLAAELGKVARAMKVTSFGFDPWTDGDLARKLTTPTLKGVPITGKDFSLASATFARAVEQGRLRHSRATAVGDDALWATRKTRGDGTWYVEKPGERPITAALAAVRAVWLATAPPPPKPNIH
jgi:phage terminase large subunit-like protein